VFFVLSSELLLLLLGLLLLLVAVFSSAAATAHIDIDTVGDDAALAANDDCIASSSLELPRDPRRAITDRLRFMWTRLTVV